VSRNTSPCRGVCLAAAAPRECLALAGLQQGTPSAPLSVGRASHIGSRTDENTLHAPSTALGVNLPFSPAAAPLTEGRDLTALLTESAH
jgi:hypothetical protein